MSEHEAVQLLRIQHNLAVALSSTSDLRVALDLILDAALQAGGIDSGGIYIFNEQGGLDLACHKGLSESFIKVVSHYEPCSPNVSLVMSGKPIYSRHENVRPGHNEANLQENLRALAVIPVLFKGKLLAVLNLASHIIDEIPESVRDSLETISGWIGGVIARVKAEEELRESQQKMDRLDRLNLVGEMAAGIGHEIRNPMTTIRGFLQLLRGKKDCAVYKEYFDIMTGELDRANSIITEFLSLARNKAIDLKMSNLNVIIVSIYPLIEADALVSDKYIETDLNAIPDLPLDEKEIRQLILNLVRNGLEAMAAGGKLKLKTYCENGNAVLAVQDNGTGIDSKVLQKIGTPFLTTKDQGTGLGLPVCFRIAERHNATLTVDTSSQGTTFFVRFKY